MGVLGSQKIKLQLPLHLPLKQAETGQPSIKNFFFKMLEFCYLVFSHSSNQNAGSGTTICLNIHGHPQTFLLYKGEINKRRKKEIPHGIFFLHHNFSIFFREMPANN